jgi:hypothetical protein
VKEKLKYLIGMGAQLSLCKYATIKEGSVCESTKCERYINLYREKTCEIEMGLSSENYETAHIFQIVGDRIQIRYGGILGQDFFIRGLRLIIRRENL